MLLRQNEIFYSDFPLIVGISEGIYNGLDYLPDVFEEFLQAEAQDPSRMRNLVLIGTDEKYV